MAGDNQHFEAQSASAGSDASITQAGGDRGIQSAQLEVDRTRSEPGQGLTSHQDSFKKSDVVGMGFPDTQFEDSSATGSNGNTQLADASGSMSDRNGGTQLAMGDANSGLKKNGDSNSDKKDPHACYVEQGSKPYQSGTASRFSEVEGTANGGVNDPTKYTAAHKNLPLDSKACVTKPGETKGVEVQINDRGPYSGNRVIDMTPPSADRVGVTEQKGLGKVDIHRKYTKDL
jgi:Lipoproteins